MIKTKIQEDQTAAIKAKDMETLNTVRYILAEIKNKEIDKRSELSDDEVITVLQKQAKQLHESIDAFTKGNRQELADQYAKQLDILKRYLPAELSDEELHKAVQELKAQNQEQYNQNPKSFIGIAMKHLRGKADPQRIMKMLESFNG